MADYKKQKWEIELEKALESISEDERSISMNKKIGASDGGKKGGSTNRATGHMKQIQKLNAHIGGRIQGKIQGSKNVENKFWENLTFEQRSKGGKISGKKRVQMDDWKNMASIAGKKSAEKRTDDKIAKMKSILKLIKKSEFRLLDVKNACDKMNIKDLNYAKKILREKSLVKQIHKGYNQFNPSLYIKIK